LVTRRLVAIALIFLPAPATPAPVRVQCQGSQCEEFEIVETKVVRRGLDGTLIWTRTLAWIGDGSQRTDLREEGDHVFCSKVRPAIITTNDGKTSAIMLAPLSAWEYDRSPRLYLTYFEACHQVGSEIATRRDTLARELGYKVLRINASRPLGIRRPESIFYFPQPNRRDRRYDQVDH
jgi:hypothetical protein